MLWYVWPNIFKIRNHWNSCGKSRVTLWMLCMIHFRKSRSTLFLYSCRMLSPVRWGASRIQRRVCFLSILLNSFKSFAPPIRLHMSRYDSENVLREANNYKLLFNDTARTITLAYTRRSKRLPATQLCIVGFQNFFNYLNHKSKNFLSNFTD